MYDERKVYSLEELKELITASETLYLKYVITRSTEVQIIEKYFGQITEREVPIWIFTLYSPILDSGGQPENKERVYSREVMFGG